MVFGTFDGLHEGHLVFFRQAKEFGDYLVVVVGRDSNVLKVKNHLPIRNENERVNEIKKVKIVNEVLLGDEMDIYRRVREEKPDVICLGYDQMKFTDKLEEKIKEFGFATEIHRLQPYHPEKFKSSIINPPAGGNK